MPIAGGAPLVYLLLADGFEEIEAVAPLDILRRAGISVVTFGIGGITITSARGLQVQADHSIRDIPAQLPDMIVLPGGEPGTSNLEKNTAVKDLILAQHHAQRWIAAICAAPRILNALGILQNRQATSFPGTAPQMTNCLYCDDPVVVSGHIITSRGAGTSLEFGYSLVSQLMSQDLSAQLQNTMVYTAR